MFKTPLSGSRWASSVGSSPSASSASTFPKFKPATALPTRDEDFNKVSRLIDRLQWKTAHLQISAEQAELSPYNGSISTERMFKLDFFEYYGLLERVLVTLLVICGVSVRGLGDPNLDGSVGEPIIGPLKKADPLGTRLQLERLLASSHRFHVNLLDEFRKATNPLREFLGTEAMQELLHKAKDLRNRWKDAENHAEGHDSRGADVSLDRREIDGMLQMIIMSLREAANFATSHTKETGRTVLDLAASYSQDEDIEMEEVPFDAVMDLYE